MNYQGYELIPALLVGGLGFGFVVAPLQSVILARVSPVYAGSASGVLATVQQVGSALGVAVIGMLLFGHLASGAGAASAGVTPGLERALTNAGLPAPAVGAVTASFVTCFQDRSAQSGPPAVPPSCQPGATPLPEAASQALTVAATQARQANFLAALLVTLRFQLVAYLVCFGLVFLLPGGPRAAHS